MSPKCIDISHYQKDIDLQSYKESGGLAIICKATEGVSVIDECYNDFRDDAARFDLAAASYHFLRPGDMVKQAQLYLDHADPQDGERVVADHEDPHVSIDDLIEFFTEIKSINPTLQLTVYSGHLAKQQLGSSRSPFLARYTSLWVAQYGVSEPEWPRGTWPTWSLWQYTDNEEIDGYYGPVDGNRFNGSDEQMLKWFGPAEPPKIAKGMPSQEPEDMQLDISFTGRVIVKRVK